MIFLILFTGILVAVVEVCLVKDVVDGLLLPACMFYYIIINIAEIIYISIMSETAAIEAPFGSSEV